MQRRGALLTAVGVAVVLAGVGVTVAVAAGSDPVPAESGDQLVIEATTSAPPSSVVTSTTVVVLPTTAVPAAPVQQAVPEQPAAGDTDPVTEPQSEPTTTTDPIPTDDQGNPLNPDPGTPPPPASNPNGIPNPTRTTR